MIDAVDSGTGWEIPKTSSDFRTNNYSFITDSLAEAFHCQFGHTNRCGEVNQRIRLDNGWVITIGRGLDFYQKPTTWYDISSSDLSLRRCLETKVDVYRR